MTTAPASLILASSSKYRQELLARLKIPFISVSPELDETPLSHEAPEQLALRLAIAKAQRVAQSYPTSAVIGADQVASLHGKPLGKPGHAAAAQAQLQQLSGQTVTFFSAMAVVSKASSSRPTASIERFLLRRSSVTLPLICPLTRQAAQKPNVWGLP